MKPKILQTDRICLYCGKEIEPQYEEYTIYYECKCLNAKKKREIMEQIGKLKLTIPNYKYLIAQKNVLYENEDI